MISSIYQKKGWSQLNQEKNKLLVVDDIAINRMLLRDLFDESYEVLEADNGEEALALISEYGEQIAIVLLDLVMPKMDGFAVLKAMRDSGLINQLPVILITSESDDDKVLSSYELGISDLIAKPFNPDIVQRRVNNVIDLYSHKNFLEEKLEEQKEILANQDKRLKQINLFLVDALATTVEFRDSESGGHIKRISLLTKIFMEMVNDEYKLSDEKIEAIANTAVLHDIGKIGIPDAILLKPGRLTEEEFAVMKTHSIRGSEILKSLDYIPDEEFFRYAYDICRHHHERWDGRGYPDGLVGDETPIWAQATALADVYDALTNERVYKKAYEHEVAVEMILNGECGMFNPKLMKKFKEISPQLPARIKQLHNK